MHCIMAALVSRPLSSYQTAGRENHDVHQTNDDTSVRLRDYSIHTISLQDVMENQSLNIPEGITEMSISEVQRIHPPTHQPSHHRVNLLKQTLQHGLRTDTESDHMKLSQYSISRPSRDFEERSMGSVVSRRRSASVHHNTSVGSRSSMDTNSVDTRSIITASVFGSRYVGLNFLSAKELEEKVHPDSILRVKDKSFSDRFRNSLKGMVNVHLFKKPLCVLLMTTYSLVYQYIILLTYIPAFATKEVRIPQTESALLITISGVLDILSLSQG